jgi:ABC-type oligopeptide transport system ATPase subunit
MRSFRTSSPAASGSASASPARLLHPYTEALLAAVPIPNPQVKRKKRLLQDDVPKPDQSSSRLHLSHTLPIRRGTAPA